MEYRGKLTPGERNESGVRFDLEVAEGDIARAEGRHLDAVRHFKTACDPFRTAFADCNASTDEAEAYDLAGGS